MDKRVSYIDVYKGICILLVIFEHIWGAGTWIGKVILSFHMACFFFISGYSNWNPSINKMLTTVKGLIKAQIFIGVANVLWYKVIVEIVLGDVIEQRWLAYFTTWYIPTYIGMIFLISLGGGGGGSLTMIDVL